LVVKPWFLWFWEPLFRHGTLHAPMLIVNNKLVSAGTVPKKEDVLKYIKK